MPTKPIEDLIPREMPAEIEKALNQFADLIDETVSFGSHVFAWCISTVKKGDEHAPIFLTFRHILELLDATAILIRKSSLEPCKIILRALFESILAIGYLFEENTEQRGKDFLIWYKYHELKYYRRHNPKDDLYKIFSSKISKDKLAEKIAIFEIPNIEEELKKIEKTINHSSFSESKIEYERYKKENGTPRWWFNLHGGPKNVEKLADHLKKTAFYETLYRHWSDFMHGTDIMRNKISISESGEALFSQIRLPIGSEAITSLTVGFALEALNLLIDKYAKDKMGEKKNWYIREIRDKYLEVSSRQIITIK